MLITEMHSHLNYFSFTSYNWLILHFCLSQKESSSTFLICMHIQTSHCKQIFCFWNNTVEWNSFIDFQLTVLGRMYFPSEDLPFYGIIIVAFSTLIHNFILSLYVISGFSYPQILSLISLLKIWNCISPGPFSIISSRNISFQWLLLSASWSVLHPFNIYFVGNKIVVF